MRRKLVACGARVVLTRDADVQLGLEARVRRAAEAGADLLVSLHFNSLPATSDPLAARGGTTFYLQPPAEPLARAIQARLASTGLSDRGVRTAPFRVILTPRIPAVLIEQLFLTHPEDEMLLLYEPFDERLAQADADGIADFALAHTPKEKQP